MAVYVENCCKSYCTGCPWAEEQERIEKEEKQKKSSDKVSGEAYKTLGLSKLDKTFCKWTR